MSTAGDKHPIGLLGVGLLGTALATRLSLAGFPLCAYDPDPTAADRLGLLGTTLASSPEHVARTCRRLFLSLPGPPEVADVIDRLEPHLAPGTMILDTTTGDPLMVERSAGRLARRNVAYLDCEVGGSSRQVASGDAIILCGGPPDAFEQAGDLLDALSSRVFHTGPAGTGTRMKLALNIAIGLHRAVLAESLEFAHANGIDPARALEILKAGPAYSRAMDVKGQKMLSGDFTPEARLAQHHKDVRLILQTGDVLGVRLPFSRLHDALLAEAEALGHGADDNSAIIKVFARRSE